MTTPRYTAVPAKYAPPRDALTLRAIAPGAVIRQEFTLAEVAQALDIAESTVWRWSQPRPRGTGGVVPSEYHLALMRLARRLKRQLSADDLVFGRAK